VEAHQLLCKELIDLDEVSSHRQLRHSQGNPDAMVAATLDSSSDMTARGSERSSLVPGVTPR
jgi:hypothetical protein